MNHLRVLKSLKKTLNSQFVRQLSSGEKPGATKRCQGRQPEQELGQPTYWTHPHLFQTTKNATDLSKQVTPGLTRQEFEQRRQNYVTCLQNYQNLYFSLNTSAQDRANLVTDPFSLLNPKSSASSTSSTSNFIAIIPSAMITHMSPDVPNKFKQNSDFFYLTGFKEPNSVLVISKTEASSGFKSALFVREKNPKVEVWEGPCTGSANVSRLCGSDLDAYSIDEFSSYLNALTRECQNRIALWRYPVNDVFKQESGPYCHIENIEAALEQFTTHYKSNSNKLIDMIECEPLNDSNSASYFNSSRYFVQLLRTRKSPAEIDLMRQACSITSEALIELIKVSHPYVNEHLLDAKLDYDCRIRGAEHLAYIPVIAGGVRATSLHYIRNNQLIKPDSLVLVDAGCQFNNYASDITRTWPVGTRFRGAQRELYEMCLNIQKHCIEQCRPGLSIMDLYYTMMRKMGDELSLGGLLDRKEFETVARINEAKPNDPLPSFYLRKLANFCPHDVGHYLGLDVHDSPEVSKHIKLAPSSVITIEPGIYVQADDELVPARYRGIGIRIEDDVVITQNGCEVLSEQCPKEIDDIEKLK